MTSKQEISADFPYKPNYIEVHGSRIHYVDKGIEDLLLNACGIPDYPRYDTDVLSCTAGLSR